MDDEALVELMREIRDQLAALPAAIAAAIGQRHAARRLSRADETALSALLPAIAKAVGNRPFSMRELIQHAALEIAPAIALREALASADPRRIGRLLRRCCGNDVGGYRVREVDSRRDGVVWAVECDNRSSQKPAKFASPKRVRF